MQYDPPRAQKKYSQSFEFRTNRFRSGFLAVIPEFLKPNDISIATVPLTAASLSLIPGLGSFYMTQKFKWSLIQFGACFLLFLLFFFTFGTFTGTFFSMTLFSFHQYLMYQSYLAGLKACQIPFPGFWKGMRISFLMVFILMLCYGGVFSVLQDHVFYANGPVGTVIQAGDRYWVSLQDKYGTGEVVLFLRGYQYRHASSGDAILAERILAAPGDQVAVSSGQITINGSPVAPTAGPLETGLSFPDFSLTVPKDAYFILYGIQTNRSFDPNWFLVPKDQINGKLAFRYSPTMEVLP